jgi:hypothetical protein
MKHREIYEVVQLLATMSCKEGDIPARHIISPRLNTIEGLETCGVNMTEA